MVTKTGARRRLDPFSSWRRMSGLARHEAVAGMISILPWLVGFLVFTAGPILASLAISLMRWDVVSPARWVGLENYVDIFSRDPDFRQALKVTLTYAALSLPLTLVLGLAISLLLNLRLRGMNIYRTLFYIPAVLPGVAVTIMWVWIFNPEFGIVNHFLSLIGIQGPRWLYSPRWALPAVIIMGLWPVGGQAIIYLAGLQNIPPHLYEAATIDGAGAWQRFWRVTIPLLTPTIFFQLVMNLIGCFQVFTEAYIATNGGPLKSTLFYMLYIYNYAFRSMRMGYGCALAWILAVVILLVTLIVFRSSPYWVYYEAEQARR